MENIFQIADNIHGLVKCSQFEKEIISTSAFNRLHYILQNSTAYKTFPANRTTRFIHSIGVMHISGLMFYNSFMNSEVKEKLLSRVKTEIQSIIESERSYLSEIFTPNITKIADQFVTEDFYNLNLGPSLSKVNQLCYLVVFQAIRASALLHDIGHPPYSHIVEYALKDIYDEIKRKRSCEGKEKEYLRTLDEYTDEYHSKIVIHEVVGSKIAERVLEESTKSLNEKLDTSVSNKAYKCFIKLVREFIIRILKSKSISDSIKDQDKVIIPLYSFFHEYFAGDIDADRLDYVVRDSINSGVEEGRLEYDRLISSMKIISYSFDAHNMGGEDFMFSFDIRVKNTIEIFFRKRWEMYRDIIYHHSVRKSDSIMYKSIYMLLKQSMEKDPSPPGNNEDLLTKNIDGLWLAVKINAENERYLTSIIQWNDNWLLSTIVDCLYDKDKLGKNDSLLKNLLKDYVENNKRFKSVIKRQIDFSTINETLVTKLDDSKTLLQLQELTSHDVSPHSITKLIEAIEQKKHISFLNSYIRPLIKLYEPILREEKISYESIVRESVADACTGIDDILYLYTYNKPKNDDSHFVILYNKGSFKLIKNYSTIYEELRLAESTFPSFYVSIYVEEGKLTESIQERVRLAIADQLTIKIKEVIEIIRKQ